MRELDRDTRRAFRVAFDFLADHSPARLDEAYWVETAADVGAACKAVNSDPLAVDLLAAVYAHLERMATKEEIFF